MVRNASSSLILLGILGLLLAMACQNDEPINLEPEIRTFPNVDQRLWPLFEAFEIEAAERGIAIDLAEVGITGEISPIEAEHVAGQCSYNENQLSSGIVTVDQQFWNNSSETFKEFIVFHELGHCYLHRGHREDANEQGFCKSIMRSGPEDCRDNYNNLTREQYIDELFGFNN